MFRQLSGHLQAITLHKIKLNLHLHFCILSLRSQHLGLQLACHSKVGESLLDPWRWSNRLSRNIRYGITTRNFINSHKSAHLCKHKTSSCVLITNLMHWLLFIYLQNIIPLHVSSHKCSSSGGYIIYMQHMMLSLSTRAHGGQSVQSLSENWL